LSRHTPPQTGKKSKKVTAASLMQMKQDGVKITAVTCYDAAFARIIEQSSVDFVLVGDSLGNVVLGFDSTIPVTMDHMVHHSAAVSRSLSRPFLVADMPFMSYQCSKSQALENAARLIRDGRAEAVKLEGGQEIVGAVKAITEAGIPVVGHLGLTPQKIHAIGGFKVQGRSEEAADQLITDALALEKAGVCALVLELVPQGLAKKLSQMLKIPTIGIGAGVHADGQVLVLHDLLGLDSGFKPKFLKTYCDMNEIVHNALEKYVEEVRSEAFPATEHSFD